MASARACPSQPRQHAEHAGYGGACEDVWFEQLLFLCCRDDDNERDEEVGISPVDTVALAGRLQQHGIGGALLKEEDGAGGMLPVPVSVSAKGGAAVARVGTGGDEALMSAETPYRQFFNKYNYFFCPPLHELTFVSSLSRFCFLASPGTGATSSLNGTVLLAAGSS